MENKITWTPAKDVMPMYKKTPYNTGIGISYKQIINGAWKL
jgi:hypothetical protein